MLHLLAPPPSCYLIGPEVPVNLNNQSINRQHEPSRLCVLKWKINSVVSSHLLFFLSLICRWFLTPAASAVLLLLGSWPVEGATTGHAEVLQWIQWIRRNAGLV